MVARNQWRMPDPMEDITEAVSERSRPLRGWEDLDPLMERVGDAHYVLLGEASHGTSEFYTWRTRISQRLIREKGFSLIAVEGDWPDCYRVNRYVRGREGSGRGGREVLGAFGRWPAWMWANKEVVVLVEWLRRHNDLQPGESQVGFYGLDVYSLWESMHSVLGYLENVDGSAVGAARRAFECFEPYAEDVQEYARATMWIPASCEEEVVRMLEEVRRRSPRYAEDGREDFFNAEQNALVARNAERYYRTMVRGDSPSWNLRDRHMVETLNRLMQHRGRDAKAIVWEHNTHIGDARATDMADAGMVNVGQLVREEHGLDDVVLVGFSTHRGTAIAGREWGAPRQVMQVPAARAGSWEDALHRAGASDKLLLFDGVQRDSPLSARRGHRALGVVYRGEYERFGNYVPTVMPRRYDALIYLDESHALAPLDIPESFEHEVPETFPTGI